MIVFRHCDRRWPFLWESPRQPAGRWHGDGEGPVQYLADTPDGAWAEFLRHEEIVDPVDLTGVERALWCVEVDVGTPARPHLDHEVMTGEPSTYPACQQEAGRLRAAAEDALVAPSAALQPRTAGGYRVERGLRAGAPREARVYVLFGPRSDAVGWLVVDRGRPPVELFGRVRPLTAT